MAEDEAKKKAAAAEAAKPNPTGTRDVTDTEIGKILGDTKQTQERIKSANEQLKRQQMQEDATRASDRMRSASEMIDAMKKAERRSFGQLEKIEPPKKK
jgi:hypothetical protein